MSGSTGMHGGGGGINGIKLEGHHLNGGSGSAGSAAAGNGSGYYCNSYTPPTAVDHGLLSSAYSEFLVTTMEASKFNPSRQLPLIWSTIFIF